MRGHLVGFHFCPVLLSGVPLFLVVFSSSLHTDLSRDELFERVEGNTWMCYTSQHSDVFFRRDVNVSNAMGENSDRMTPPPLNKALWHSYNPVVNFHSSPFILCWPQQFALKKYKVAPKSGENNGNFLRATLISLRASSILPLYGIKNQDDFLRQGN